MGKVSLREQAADAAALAQAAFAGHVPEAPAGEGAAAGEPNTSADADLALALQMQEVGPSVELPQCTQQLACSRARRGSMLHTGSIAVVMLVQAGQVSKGINCGHGPAVKCSVLRQSSHPSDLICV